MNETRGVLELPAVGMLYLVGTPLGNLEDITLRALRVLREVELVAAEDTRVTRKLLSHYDIRARLVSYHRHNLARRTSELVTMLKQGKRIALVSDAGMPGISDPGEELVRMAVQEGIEIVPVPGPSAAITALAVSGLPTSEFIFVGFLPRTAKQRRGVLASLATQRCTLIAYEAPHRLLATLRDLQAVFGTTRVVIARELTKAFEEIKRGTAEELLSHFTATPPRGELTLVVAASQANFTTIHEPQNNFAEAVREAKQLIAAGKKKSEAAKLVAAQYQVARTAVYRALSA